MLGDDREQVGEQLVLERREVGRDLDGAVVDALGAVDRAMRGDGDRPVGDRPGGATGDPRGSAGAERQMAVRGVQLVGAETLVSAIQAAASVVSLLVRYRRPSSSRRS